MNLYSISSKRTLCDEFTDNQDVSIRSNQEARKEAAYGHAKTSRGAKVDSGQAFCFDFEAGN